MIYFALTFELIAIVFLSFSVEKLWAKYINNKALRIFLLPGAAAHELSHAVLCLITGTTIKNLNVFKLKENDIQYEKPKLSVVGNFLIAAAPIFGCGIILIFLAAFLGSSAGLNDPIPDVTAWYSHAEYLIKTIKATIMAFWEQITLHRTRPLIFIPLAIIFTVSMSPSRNDIKFLVLGFIISGAVFFSMEMFGISLRDYGWWMTFLNGLWHLITLSISVLIITLCISLFLIVIFRGFKLTFSRKEEGKGSKRGESKAETGYSKE